MSRIPVPPPEKAGGPAGRPPSSVADKLQRKPYKPIPQKTKYGAKGMGQNAFRTPDGGRIFGRDKYRANEENQDIAIWDHLNRLTEEGAHAGGGMTDILGDKKGPPTTTKKAHSMAGGIKTDSKQEPREPQTPAEWEQANTDEEWVKEQEKANPDLLNPPKQESKPIPPAPGRTPPKRTGIKGPPGITGSKIPPVPKQKGGSSGRIKTGLSTYGKQMA